MKKGKTTNLTNHTNFYFGNSELNLNSHYSSSRIIDFEVKPSVLPLSSSVREVRGYIKSKIRGYLNLGIAGKPLPGGLAIRRDGGTVC
jgi:hypothetical protein